MKFQLNRSLEILSRTPDILEQMLSGLSDEWLLSNEGENTWSAFDVMGHLIHGETTDWVTRTKIILYAEGDKKFKPFDRFAQFNDSKGKSTEQLLHEFKQLRKENLTFIQQLNPDEKDLDKTGIHPAFGAVTLRQLLACWVVHDLNNIAQIARVMAKQYKTEVGPWVEYLRILQT